MTIAEHIEETILGIVGLIIVILFIWWALRERCQYCEHRVAYHNDDELLNILKNSDLTILDDLVRLREQHPVIYTEEDLIE